MFKVQDGICSLRDFNVKGKIPGKLTIAVHPFYLDRHIKGSTANYQEYMSRRNDFLKKFSESMLIFEEEGVDVESRYRECFPQANNLFFVETWKNNPYPLNVSWEDIFSFARRFKLPLNFMGGQYRITNENGDEFHRGCLAYTLERFIEDGFNPRILKGLTFS